MATGNIDGEPTGHRRVEVSTLPAKSPGSRQPPDGSNQAGALECSPATEERLIKLVGKILRQALADQKLPLPEYLAKKEPAGLRNKLVAQTGTEPIENGRETFLTPTQLARRWSFHTESIRRRLRKRQIASILIGRKRLIALSEVLRLEAEGRIPARDIRFQEEP
jgi:hypothetical protein